VTAAPAADVLGAAMVDFVAGRQAPAWLRVAPGRRLTHDLAAYFAPVTAHERALLDQVEGPVLDVGCGPARHARLLQARGLTAIGLDRSLLALGLARSLGLRHWLHADARAGTLPSVRTALLLDGNLGLAGTPAGAVELLYRRPQPAVLADVSSSAGALPAMGGSGHWSCVTSTATWSGLGDGGCRLVSRPSSSWPTRPAGASSTPSRRVPTIGLPFPSTVLVSSAGSPWPDVAPGQPGCRRQSRGRGRGQRQADRAPAGSALDSQQRAGPRRPCRAQRGGHRRGPRPRGRLPARRCHGADRRRARVPPARWPSLAPSGPMSASKWPPQASTWSRFWPRGSQRRGKGLAQVVDRPLAAVRPAPRCTAGRTAAVSVLASASSSGAS
jgi:hypothetical protein